jgi:2-polyprenyl-3-methyl-5-hydroxy-6-metoxy-1,4-benzoquinol methylase
MDEASVFFDDLANSWIASYADDAPFQRRQALVTLLLKTELSTALPGAALDVGCGAGVFAALLATLGWRVHAIDLSRAMLDAAINRCREVLGPRNDLTTFERADIDDFEAPRESYDLVLCLNVLEYVDHDERALATIVTALAPEGRLLLSVPNRRSVVRIVERLSQPFRHLARHGRANYLDLQRHQYTPAEIDRRLEDLGLTKAKELFWSVGFGRPQRAVPLLERRWWAGMYCALYVKSPA